MGSESRRKRRRSIRLEAYDYSQPGAYFVTICTQHGECLLGQVIDGRMQLNDAGRMVQSVWDELPDHYPGVRINAFVVMPNHVHGIVVLTGGSMIDNLVGATPSGCPKGGLTSDDQDGQACAQAHLGACPYGAAAGGTDVVAGCCAPVQIIHHREIPARCETCWLVAFSWQALAAQLLGARDPRRARTEPDPGVHCEQSRPLGGGPYAPGGAVESVRKPSSLMEG